MSNFCRRAARRATWDLFQIERVEAFGEPAVHRSEKFAGLIPQHAAAIIASSTPCFGSFASVNEMMN